MVCEGPYFPKGTDFSVQSQAYLKQKWLRQLNERPQRETLQLKPPEERI